jgi:hypothetical protein
MKSPEYTVPVMDFIDEQCLVFDEEEVAARTPAHPARGVPLTIAPPPPSPQESKLEFSNVHEKFVEVVFGLLEKFLGEIGVSQEE